MPNAPFLRENLTIFSISGPAALVCPTKMLWGPSFSPFCGCIALAALCALPHRAAGAALCGCLAGYALALRKAFRSLDGMNGDISGYALTLSELCGAAVWALI